MPNDTTKQNDQTHLNQGFIRYKQHFDDEVIINTGNPLMAELNKSLFRYNGIQDDIANYLFSAISNTQSQKIYFPFSEMATFIENCSSSKPKHLFEDVRYVLKDLQSLKTKNGAHILFDKADIDQGPKIIKLELSPLSIWLFKSPSQRKNN